MTHMGWLGFCVGIFNPFKFTEKEIKEFLVLSEQDRLKELRE